MPTYHSGDIFRTARDEKYELAIVFGHLGYNELGQKWGEFVENSLWTGIKDPFLPGFAGKAQMYLENQWMWFVSAYSAYGMNDCDLVKNLDEALDWAKGRGLRRIITNGINQPGHGMNTIQNRASDDERTVFLVDYLTRREGDDGIGDGIALISLNDVFVRFRNGQGPRAD
jgi:hypothetical protein